jgi:hypothetical protein
MELKLYGMKGKKQGSMYAKLAILLKIFEGKEL